MAELASHQHNECDLKRQTENQDSAGENNVEKPFERVVCVRGHVPDTADRIVSSIRAKSASLIAEPDGRVSPR
jgi:hypothetical protein